MKLNRLVRSLLKTVVNVMDLTAERVDRASDGARHIADEAKRSIDAEQDHTIRRILTFSAGLGLGFGAGILLAPSSGAELRESIGEKVKRRVSTHRFVTGTEAP